MPEIDFEAIGGRVMYELHRRLATPELAQDLPGTLLMKVAMDYVKHLEKKNELEELKLTQEKLDPLEMIDQEGLSLAMRIKILSDYIDELEDVYRRSGNRIEQLIKEYASEHPEVVPDVQDVVPED